jgi:hypothetical protein
MDKIHPNRVYEEFAFLVSVRQQDQSVEVDLQKIVRLLTLGLDFSRCWRYMGQVAPPLPALHFVIYYKDQKLIRCLLKLGADVNAVNIELKDVVSFAESLLRTESSQVLRDRLMTCIQCLIKRRAKYEIVSLFSELSNVDAQTNDYDLVAMICSKFLGCNLSEVWNAIVPGKRITNATIFALHLRNIQSSYLTDEVNSGWVSDVFLSLHIHILVIIYLSLETNDNKHNSLKEFLVMEIGALREALMLERDSFILSQLGLPFSCLKKRIVALGSFILLCTGWKNHCVHVELQRDLAYVFNAGELSDHHKRIPSDDSLDACTFKPDNPVALALSLIESRWSDKQETFETLVYSKFSLESFHDDRNAPIPQLAGNCVVQSYIFSLAFRCEKVYSHAWKDLLDLILSAIGRFERSDCHLQSRSLPLLSGTLSLAEFRFPGYLCYFADVCRVLYHWSGCRRQMVPIEEVAVLLRAFKGTNHQAFGRPLAGNVTTYSIACKICDTKKVMHCNDWREEEVMKVCDQFNSNGLELDDPLSQFIFCILDAVICYRGCVAKIESKLVSAKECQSFLNACFQKLSNCISYDVQLLQHSYLRSHIFYYQGLVKFYLNDFRKAIEFVLKAISSYDHDSPADLPTQEYYISSLAMMFIADNEPDLCLQLLNKFRWTQTTKLSVISGGIPSPGPDAPKFVRNVAFGLAYKMKAFEKSESNVFFNLSKTHLEAAFNAYNHEEIKYLLFEVDKAIHGLTIAPENHDAEEHGFIPFLRSVYGLSDYQRQSGHGVKRPLSDDNHDDNNNDNNNKNSMQEIASIDAAKEASRLDLGKHIDAVNNLIDSNLELNDWSTAQEASVKERKIKE